MIHYQLRCDSDHEFDGWFAGSAAFDRQAGQGLLECPACGSHDVARALMAPAIGRARPTPPTADSQPTADRQPMADGQPAAESETVGAVPPPTPAGETATSLAGPVPAAIRAHLARLRREIETRCDYLGDDFAAEARRIHDGAAPARGIYGEASAEDVESLAEDGIEVARIPWVPRADS